MWDKLGLKNYIFELTNNSGDSKLVIDVKKAEEIARRFNSNYKPHKSEDHLLSAVSWHIRQALGATASEVRTDYKNKQIIIFVGRLKAKQTTITNHISSNESLQVDREDKIVSDTSGFVVEDEETDITWEIGNPTGQKFYYLEILEDVGHPLVPRVPEYKARKLMDKTDIEILTWLLANRKPVLLKGHAGLGKNHIIEYIAMKTNRPLVRFNLDGGTEPEDMVGQWEPVNGGLRWRDGLLTIAVRKGYIVVLDEINAAEPEILFILHPLLEDNDPKLIIKQTGEIIRPHSEFRIVATMNPSETGQYGGTKDLNAALQSRFYPLEFNWLDTYSEIKVLQERTGIDYESARTLVKLAQRLRNAMEQDMLRIVVGTRDLLQVAEIYTKGLMNLRDACRFILLGKASIYERHYIIDQIDNTFKPE